MMHYLRILIAGALVLMPVSAAAPCGPVKAVQLSVDGRIDGPLLGIGNARPALAWQMVQTGPCTESVCPGDWQTAYRVQAASTVADLRSGNLLWDSGKVDGSAQQLRFGRDLGSRDTVAWRVRVWGATKEPSGWSKPFTWTVGLLNQADWGDAHWIDYPDRADNQPLPLFARQFNVTRGRKVVTANLYLSGVGLHHATVNGEEVTDEVLAPGNSNYQLSTEYRTYDIKKLLRSGTNAVGVSLGNGPAYIRRSIRNPAVDRNTPYSWWESQLKGNGTLAAAVSADATLVTLSSGTGYHVGGTINIDTGDSGEKLESRTITAISGTAISFTPGLKLAHEAGARVTGSGNNIAASDPAAGAAITPRLIGRLEITYDDGSTAVIVTDRSWRTALGPWVFDSWYSGSDYDARRERPEWDGPRGDLEASGWISAGLAPPPNLATKLVARAAEAVKIQERFTPVSVTNPVPGTWVFDFGQNMAGWPLLKLPKLPAGTTIKVAPAESLNANGTVDQASLGPASGSRGRDLFHTYTTAGRDGGETWHPAFNYFGMQWVQVTGLPSDFKPSEDLVTGLRLQVDATIAGTFTSSNARINRIAKMARYSFASNMMSVFTDCPGREKLSYPADYISAVGAIYRNFHIDAYLRNTMHHLVDGQSIANTSMRGNVPLKAPVYDVGYSGRFGDEINWGNSIVLVPSLLHDMYGDTSIMTAHYDQMVLFIEYIQRQKAQGHIVDAALGDWIEATGQSTSGRITGKWGYYLAIRAMARMANITGHSADADRYTTLAGDIRDAFNAAFWSDSAGRYTNTGNNGTSNATQAAQALALDAGLVPDGRRKQVTDALVELVQGFPAGNRGPHLGGGTIGMGPIVRALAGAGRHDVLWQALEANDQPSYGYFLAQTAANPNGFTTIGEQWDRGSSKNHMILAQIDEWFHAGIAGIRPTSFNTLTSTWEDGLTFQPQLVGDLESAAGTYQTRRGEARSEWKKTEGGQFTLKVTVPANTKAEVRVPSVKSVNASARAKLVGQDDSYTIYSVPSGNHSFKAKVTA